MTGRDFVNYAALAPLLSIFPKKGLIVNGPHLSA